MEAYSKEFRRDVLAAWHAGGTTHDVALQFGISKSWVRRVKQERREQGKTAPKTTLVNRDSMLSCHRMLTNPDMVLQCVVEKVRSSYRFPRYRRIGRVFQSVRASARQMYVARRLLRRSDNFVQARMARKTNG